MGAGFHSYLGGMGETAGDEGNDNIVMVRRMLLGESATNVQMEERQDAR